MKLPFFAFWAVAFASLLFSNCTMAQNEKPVRTLTTVNCTVTQVAGEYTLVPDEDNSQRYMPRNMELKYRKEGLKVVVSGNVFAIPPNVRMIGTPFEITKIAVRNTEAPVKPKDADKGKDGPKLQPVSEGNAEVKTGVNYAEVQYTTNLSNVKGTIIKIDNTYLIETGPGMRYMLMGGGLPAEFQVEKTKVIFSGQSGNPPANVRMKGNPLKLASIKKAPVKKWWQFWK